MAAATLLRASGFFTLWLALDGGTQAADLAIGLLAAALATRASLALSPPVPRRLAPLAMLRLGLSVLRASLVAGLDTARRALDPRLPIRPGEAAVPFGLPPGPARDQFRLLASLQPGTLPVAVDPDGRLLVHALDTRLPVERETRAVEALFAAASTQGAARD
ncbi:Na+/H+ antiporter subunit E [Roseicella frigidaeris]|uniref:Sodium:proton antiporter n=1 Tax=Roseicella frigidaeris TaxID=2230885 RepID=A0A327MA57_9PROT|nr:Na+/H+ antiporter subunit E [Roseicella frigidaeris]RAI59202.1 sodium:proton antiporter [Roseicella frigidaeris]